MLMMKTHDSFVTLRDSIRMHNVYLDIYIYSYTRIEIIYTYIYIHTQYTYNIHVTCVQCIGYHLGNIGSICAMFQRWT